MIQKEVGDKLLCQPGDDGYGPLTIICQYLCHVERALDVPAECFNPAPKVDSSFMVLVRREKPLYSIASEKLFERLIKGAFVMRRKTLVNNLMSAFSLTREQATECLQNVGLSSQIRAEMVSIEQFALLTWQLDSMN